MTALTIACAALVAAVVFAVYWASVTYTAYDNRPRLTPADVVYQENFASACCALNGFTRLFWAAKCARLIVTRNSLIITSWFPFILLSALWDIEHVMLLTDISSISQLPAPLPYLRLIYIDRKGRTRVVGLIPEDRLAFLRAVGRPIEV